MGFALMRVEAGLEVEAVTADVTDVGFVSLLFAALVVFLHVGREVEDGGQHGIAHLALEVHGSLGVVLRRGLNSLFLDVFTFFKIFVLGFVTPTLLFPTSFPFSFFPTFISIIY